MTSTPEFNGIRKASKPMDELWSRDMFPVSIAVALANTFSDRGVPLNYITTDSGNRCSVSTIDVAELYGCSKGRIRDVYYDFDSVYDPYEDVATGVPDSDLVLRDGRGHATGRLEIVTSVVPDAFTRDSPDDRMGPEITVRTPLLESCGLSMATSLRDVRGALDILEEGIPFDHDWSDRDSFFTIADRVVGNLDRVQRSFSEKQSPFLLHTIWKSEPDGPFMADDAMDSFVWSDFAFSRMFLDPTSRRIEARARPMRAAVRLYRIVTSILRGENPDLDSIISETEYGISGHKEFMVNGMVTNRYMACDRLTRPKATSADVAFLATSGFESMIMPERRLDTSIYQAVRAIRG